MAVEPGSKYMTFAPFWSASILPRSEPLRLLACCPHGVDEQSREVLCKRQHCGRRSAETDQAHIQSEVFDLHQGAPHRRIDLGIIIAKSAAAETCQQNNVGDAALGI